MEPAVRTVLAEIEAMHAAMGRWMSGEDEQSDPVFQRFRDAMDKDFVAVSPDGLARRRDAVLDTLWEAWGSAEGATLEVRVDQASATLLQGPFVLAMYREWQKRYGQVRGRVVSAVLKVDATGTARWLHRHGTFLPR